VGREREIGEIRDLLEREGCRLVTLTGPGGIGKTRIAFEAGRQLLDQFEGRVRVVLLDTLDDHRLVRSRIGQALDLPEVSDSAGGDPLLDALSNGRWLLILDNFERLGAAAPEIARLLASIDELQLLITSRNRLHIQGEHEYVTPPLPIPHGGDLATLEAAPSVALFLQSAHTAAPGLVLDDANAQAVAEICRQLDGVPLAIELAAARSKILSPEAILARLDRRLPLLTGGPRDVPDRLRTMRDAIDWSYELLPRREQAFFRQLCVFSGSFTLQEAVAVGFDGAPEESIEAVDLLGSLVDNSLIWRQTGSGEPRFAMLETIREFGLDELAAHDGLATARDRHADYFIALAEAAFIGMRGAGRIPWLERLEAAHDNLRAALSWMLQTSDGPRATQLAGALWRFWWSRSYPVEGRSQIERALALPDAAANGAHYARALTGAGALAETMGDYAAAGNYYDEAVSVWNELGDQTELAHALLFRWLVALNIDDETRMDELAQESLRMFVELGDQWGIATSQLELGVVCMLRGEFATGEQWLRQAIEGFEALSDSWGVAMSEGVLGNIKTAQGDFADSAPLLERSLSRLVALDDQWGVATVLLSIARTAAAQRNYAQVARISGAIARLHEDIGALVKVPFRERYRQNLSEAERQLGREQFARLYAEGATLSPTEAVAAAFGQSGAQSESKPRAESALSVLSPREREVLRLIPGRTGREIADELFISESTVRTHIEHILNKLGMRNQKELVAAIYEQDLL
jgi:predicted ATPase/DNA-binding CsgD family transcriptional regulator